MSAPIDFEANRLQQRATAASAIVCDNLPLLVDLSGVQAEFYARAQKLVRAGFSAEVFCALADARELVPGKFRPSDADLLEITVGAKKAVADSERVLEPQIIAFDELSRGIGDQSPAHVGAARSYKSQAINKTRDSPVGRPVFPIVIPALREILPTTAGARCAFADRN